MKYLVTPRRQNVPLRSSPIEIFLKRALPFGCAASVDLVRADKFTAGTMTAELYPNLCLQEKQIRLLEIHQGSSSEQIVCSLSTAILSDSPQYDALSYVWGDEYGKEPIFVNELPVRITQNLEAAIRDLRRLDRSIILWIDALCIDQKNTLERNHQVSIMGDVYRKAHEVYAWLGELNAEVDQVLSMIETLGGDLAIHWDPKLPHSISKQMVSAGYLVGLCKLFSRPWWTRVWTVQEAILPERLTFFCGLKRVDASRFFGFSNSFKYHYHACCGPFLLLQDQSMLRNLRYQIDSLCTMEFFRCHKEKTHLWQQMAYYRTRACKEPKDKVYGFLGWGNPEFMKDFKPDYSLSDRSVYEEIAARMIRDQDSLGMLREVLPEQSLRTETQIKDLPSWVPDWSISVPFDVIRPIFHIRQPHSQLRAYSACKGLVSSPSHQKPGKLALKGVIFGAIDVVGDAFKRSEAGATIVGLENIKTVQIWRSLARLENAPNRVYRGPSQCTHSGSKECQIHISAPETADDAFWEVLGSYLDQASPDGLTMGDQYLFRDLQAARKSYQETLESVMTPTQCSSKQRVDPHISNIILSIGSRRFFASRNPRELFGLAPFSAQVNDQIAIFIGSPVPYTIRKHGDTGKREWTYIGEAYVHGFMDGEALDLGGIQEIVLV